MNTYLEPAAATKIRVYYGVEGWELDAADDDDNYTEACWTHFKGQPMTKSQALQVVPEFAQYIERPDLPVKVDYPSDLKVDEDGNEIKESK